MTKNMYKIQDFIWRTLRNYSPMYASLGLVTGIVVSDLKECKCSVTVIDDTHSDYRTIEVDGHLYRIVRGKDKFSTYDVHIIN